MPKQAQSGKMVRGNGGVYRDMTHRAFAVQQLIACFYCTATIVAVGIQPALSAVPDGCTVLQGEVEISDQQIREVVTTNTPTANVKHLNTAAVSPLAPQEIWMKQGEAIFTVRKPTLIATEKYLIDAKPGDSIFLASIGDVLVIRNLAPRDGQNITIRDLTNSFLELEPGKEMIAGLDPETLDDLYTRSSIKRKSSFTLETFGRPDRVLTRMSSNLSFQSSPLVASLKHSSNASDKQVTARIDRLETFLGAFEDSTRLSIFLQRN